MSLTDCDGVKKFATYSFFSAGIAATKHCLSVGGYAGTAGDALTRPSGAVFPVMYIYWNRQQQIARLDSCTYMLIMPCIPHAQKCNICGVWNGHSPHTAPTLLVH